MGLIAPVTVVGATVLHCVDVLAGLTMAQLLRPGHPVLFGGAPAAFHMKTGSSPMAAIEALQLYGAYVAVAKTLELPTQAYMALSESKFNDAQAGAESFGGALLAALAGVNSVSGPGMLDYVMVYSLEKLVLDNELCGQALRFVRAIEPKNDLPMLDMVHELLAEKHLLTSEHTLKHWPAEMHLPDPVFDRLNRDAWRKAGSLTMQDRLRAEVERGLNAYSKPPIDPRIVEEMCSMVKAGMENPHTLPAIPEFAAAAESGPGRRPSRRKT
jgi:trimethylamine--corrinoid protein Co-methyltransferase